MCGAQALETQQPQLRWYKSLTRAHGLSLCKRTLRSLTVQFTRIFLWPRCVRAWVQPCGVSLARTTTTTHTARISIMRALYVQPCVQPCVRPCTAWHHGRNRKDLVRQIPVRGIRDVTPPFISCVSLDRTDGDFESYLASLKLVEGRDYYLFG